MLQEGKINALSPKGEVVTFRNSQVASIPEPEPPAKELSSRREAILSQINASLGDKKEIFKPETNLETAARDK